MKLSITVRNGPPDMTEFLKAFAPYIPVILLILGGMGWLIRYLLASKDKQLDVIEERSRRVEAEAEVLAEKLMQRTEEALLMRAENSYLQRSLKDCQHELDVERRRES